MDRITISAECVVRLGNPDDGPVLRCERAPRPVHAETEISTPAAAARALLNRPDGNGPASPRVRAEAGPGWDEPGRGWGGGQGNGSQDDHGPRNGRGAVDGSGGPVPSLLDPGQARRPADYRLSVDRRPTAVLPLPGRLLRIGRAPDNELVLSDLSVSRHHAELRKSSSGNYEIADLGSHNGTFVNGQRATSATLSEKVIVSVGHAAFRLTAGELREYIDAGDVSLVAQDLVVEVGGGKILLDHVSFAIARWGFAAIASTANLNRIIPPASMTQDPLWDHQASTWLTDMGAMIALAVVFTVITWWRLNRLSPGRRK